MSSPQRLTRTDDRVVACPACDHAGDIYERQHSNTHGDDPDDPFYCATCKTSFSEPVVRDAKPVAKYADLTPADVGL